MKFLIPSAIIILLALYMIYNANGAYREGYAVGYAAERPAERIMREHDCIPKTEIPEFYPYLKVDDVTIIMVENAQGKQIPLVVCSNEVIQEHIDTLIEEVSEVKK